MNAVVEPEKKLIKLDLGCGPRPLEGFVGVDALDFGNANIVKHDLRITPWPFEDNSVVQAHCSHFLEHLTNLNDKWERVKFFNELYRVMVPGTYNAAGAPETGFAKIIIPHWASQRFYGDPTHKEPFSEMGVYYLDPEWRKNNAPHTDISNNPNGYSCHWACTLDWTIHQNMVGRNSDYVQMAMTHWKESAQDLIINMVCKK